MPISTDLSIEPYFESFDVTKDYYKILFRPGVSVQVRELNELQTMLQRQIELFGDNIFKRGTIVDGCAFAFHGSYPYVKIEDSEVGGPPALPESYIGKFVKNNAGLKALVVDSAEGFESTDPDLKTIYLNYVNSGDSGEDNKYSAGDRLTVYDPDEVIESVDVSAAGSGFTNNDTVVFASALVVNVTSGSFSVADNITNLDKANSTIISIDTTTLAEANQVIIAVKPLTTDLARANSKSSNWKFSVGEEIQKSDDAGIVGTIEDVIGSGAVGVMRTTSAGRVSSITITNGGSGYSTVPHTTIKSTNNSTGIAALSLVANTELARVRVSALSNTVGNGYAFSVSDGVIYQRGYFERVAEQRVIVKKYSQFPNNVSVGFVTEEEIIDSDIDTNLLDNATGEPNETAPGANRLKLTPVLTVKSKDDADEDDEFFPIVEFSEGQPYKQQQTTSYNKIGDALAESVYDASGNYVTNKFLVTTRSPVDTSYEGNSISVVIDPGTGYVSGHKVETLRNYTIDIDKALDTKIAKNQYVSIDYGSYFRLKEMAGLFQYSTGDTIYLYDTAQSYLSNSSFWHDGGASPIGTAIGTARIRSMLHETGVPGEPNTSYQLYMFDIRMYTGKNIKNTLGVYYNGTNGKGFADVITELNSTTNRQEAKLYRKEFDTLLFSSGVASLKNANNVTYSYRTIDQSLSTANSGLIVKNISASPDEFFPYSGNLSSINMINDLYVVPIGGGLRGKTSLTGTVASYSNSTLTGSGTDFQNELEIGDYVYVSANSTGGGDYRRVVKKVSGTSIRLESNLSFTNSSAVIYRYFPNNVPVPFGSRSGLVANVDVNRNILTLDYGMEFYGLAVNTAVGVNIERQNVTQITKSPQRDKYIRIRPANSTSGVMQPSYLSGTLSMTVGSNSVTGTKTKFSNQLTAGDTILVETIFYPNGLNKVNANNSVKHLFQRTIGTITNSTAMTFTQLTPKFSNTGITNIKYGKGGSFKGPWCIGVPDVFRLKHVYLGANNTFDGTEDDIVDVKDQFYIDHNQTANYLDLSYLYLKPKSGLKFSSNDVLLVQFDYFTTSGVGFATTPSYTSANATQIATYDSLSVDDLSDTAGAVSSFEIPELNSSSGKYYDLMNTIDFRPVACTVITPATSAASAPVNPVYALSFGSTSNPNNDKKFPVPGSSAKMNIEYYLGRIDSVIMDKNGNISVLKGTPEAVEKKRKPAIIPNDTIVLNQLNIPEYPNIPSYYSKELAGVLNTHIASGKYSQKRNADSVIQTILTEQDIEINQPTRYTMADIGELEKRIDNLEYYVALTLLETKAKDRVIPSSVSTELNRFKFGFFVDDFDSFKTSDIDNPSYAADIEDGRIVPPSQTWNVDNKDSFDFTCDYMDYQIVSQDNATVSANGNTINCEPNTSVSNSWMVTKETTGFKGKLSSKTVKLSTITSPATLYANFRGSGDYIEIWQGNTKILTGNNATYLTTADKTKMLSNTIPNNPFNGTKASDLVPFTQENGEYRGVQYTRNKNSFKINWTHNPSNGTDYLVKVLSFTENWEYALEYPINSNTVSCNTKADTTKLVTYTGSLDVEPSVWKFMTGEYTKQKNVTEVAGKKIVTYNYVYKNLPINKKYKCIATGLRPNTKHTFKYEGVTYPIEPEHGQQGDPIFTDESGTATFYFYYNDRIEAKVDSINKNDFKVAGEKMFEFTSNNSSAKTTVMMKIESPVNPNLNN